MQATAKLEPSLRAAVDAIIAARAVEAARPPPPPAPAHHTHAGTVKRTPRQELAHCRTQLGRAEREYADFVARASRKAVEASERRAANSLELQAFIDEAVAALAEYNAQEDAAAAAWRDHQARRTAELAEKQTLAQLATAAAVEAAAAAGDAADKIVEPMDAEGSDAGDDGECDMGGDDGMDVTRHSIGDDAPKVADYVVPPRFEGTLDDAATDKLLRAKSVLLHWVQQGTRLPLSFNEVGLAPADVKQLVGEAAWLAEFTAEAIVGGDCAIPAGLPGVLLDAVIRVPLVPAPADAAAAAQAAAQATLRKAAAAETAARRAAAAALAKKGKRSVVGKSTKK